MDIGRAFSFVFDDQDWLKNILIGAVLVLTGIGFIPVIGYGVEVARRVVRGHPQPLPEWDDWGTKIVEGFLSAVIGFVWALPLILISSCTWIIWLPIAGVGDGGEVAGWLAASLSGCVGLFSLAYGLLLALVFPAAVMNYATTGQISAAFRFGEVLGMVRNNIGAYLIVVVVSLLASLVGSLGSIVLGCGALFTTFYGTLATCHSYGQAFRVAAGNVESEIQPGY